MTAQNFRGLTPMLFATMALRKRFTPLYGVLFALIVAAFLWQMLHGICPVP